MPPLPPRMALTRCAPAAENPGLLLCWPAMLLNILLALGIEHIGWLHIKGERSVRPGLLSLPVIGWQPALCAALPTLPSSCEAMWLG